MCGFLHRWWVQADNTHTEMCEDAGTMEDVPDTKAAEGAPATENSLKANKADEADSEDVPCEGQAPAQGILVSDKGNTSASTIESSEARTSCQGIVVTLADLQLPADRPSVDGT